MDGLRRMFADFDEDWEGLRVDPADVREADEPTVVAICRISGRGRASHVDIDVQAGFVWRFSGAKLVYARTYSDPADAYSAAGIEE